LQVEFKQLILDFVKYNIIYTIFCINIIKTSNKNLTKFKISKNLKNLKKVYNNKLIRILWKLEKENYVVKF